MDQRVKELRKQLKEICVETDTRLAGILLLIKYYRKEYRWSEEKAIEYAIGLFHNGTIRQIKLLNSKGEEL